MKYRGYDVNVRNRVLTVKGVRDFDLKHIFECGQCFRWIPCEEGSYHGIVSGKAVNVSYQEGILTIENTTEKDFVDLWYEYFDLGTDYSVIKAALSKDPILKEAIETGYGIRLLRQDFWETMISFIISSNNLIPRIMKIVETLSCAFGTRISEESNYCCFPEAAALSGATLEKVQQCRAGYRGKYIYETAQRMTRENITKEALVKIDTESARKELMKFSGVGPKVADCILLYSGIKFDVFPTDVWVKRVMEELYMKEEATLKEIQLYAKTKFGDLAGYAQQYLFYHARRNKIGLN